MTRSRRVVLGFPVALALVVPLAFMAPTAQAQVQSGHSVMSASASTSVAQAARTKRKPKHKRYHVYNGPVFNNATGSYAEKSRIQRLIIGAIDHAHKGSSIHIASWSFFSGPATSALIRAHNRGVTVRFVMARGKSKNNGSFSRLKAGLKKGNAKRRVGLRSYVKTCRATCRGTHGTMHSKIFLFSHTGASRNVAMWGSANLTSAAVRVQWNDMFSNSRNVKLYNYIQSIYKQLWADKARVSAYKIHQFGPIGFAALPAYKRTNTDWVTDQLRQVSCTGATNVSGGHTRIQIAQAIMYGTVGDRIARHLRKLAGQGCRVSVIYTRMGRSTARILSSIPKKHYVQDTNGDGFFDRYLHMKVMAIRGVIGTDKSATLVMNGSENWSAMSTGNDETVGYFSSPWVWSKYSKQLNWLWNHVPVSVPYYGYTTGGRLAPPSNPYAHLDLD